MARLRIGVAGAASANISKKKKTLAYLIGQRIGLNDHILIYGAGKAGCMGACLHGYKSAHPALDPFGSTTREIQHFEGSAQGIHLIVDESLAKREELYELCDILIILPGGCGTLREFWGMLTKKRVGEWDGRIWVVDEGWVSQSLKSQLKDLEIQKLAPAITKDVEFLTADDIIYELHKLHQNKKHPHWLEEV